MNKLGIVGIVPFWSQASNMNVDSNYQYLRIVLPEMLRQTEKTLFLIFFPNGRYGAGKWVYEDDGFSKISDRVKFINWNYDTQMRSSVLGFDPLRFKQIDAAYSPTIYWMQQVESAYKFFGGYSQSYNKSARPSIVSQHMYVIHKSLPGPYKTFFPRLWSQIGGALASQQNIYLSNYARKMADESFSEFLNKKTAEIIKNKTKTIHFGMLRGDEPLSGKAGKKTKPVFIYNHRFEHYKKTRDTFDVFDELRKKYKFEVWATQIKNEMTGGAKNFNYDRSVFSAKREQYLLNIAVPAINTSNSVHETFCISAVDSLALGHLGVFPKSVTFPELVPNDYPYLFSSKKEQLEMLNYILNNFESEYNKWRLILSEFVRKKFSLRNYVNKYVFELISAENQMRDYGTSEKNQNFFEHFFSNIHGKTTTKRIKNVIIKNGVLGGQSLNERRVVRELLKYRPDVEFIFGDNEIIVKLQ